MASGLNSTFLNGLIVTYFYGGIPGGADCGSEQPATMTMSNIRSHLGLE